MENSNQNDEMLNGGLTENGSQSNWNYDPVTGQPINRQSAYQNQNAGPTPEYVYKDMLKQQKKIQDNSSRECRYLCFASLACWLVSNFFFFFENQIQRLSNTLYDKVIGPSTGLLLIAGYVLVVIAMVKYPRNNFARVLVVIYILEIVLLAIVVVIAIIACAALLSSCFGGFQDCLRMG